MNNAKRALIIAALVSAFGSTFVSAKQVCTTDASGLSQSCYDDGKAIDEPDDNSARSGVNPNPTTPYGVGEMPYSVDREGMIDKVNVVDIQAKNAYDHADDAYNSAGRAHERLDHDADRLDAHAHSIGTLFDTKVDKETFEADQRRQDEATGKAQGTADNAQAAANGAQSTATYAVGETEKLWQDKASAQNVEELRGAHIEEVSERIKNDRLEAEERAKQDNIEKDARVEGDKRNANDIAGLQSSKAERSEVIQLNQQTNINARGYAAQAERNANAYTDAAVSASEKRTDAKINDVKDKAYSGVALSEAMTALTPTIHADKSAIGAAVGTYQNHAAVAIGYSHRFSDDATTLRLNSGVSDRNVGVALGVTHEF